VDPVTTSALISGGSSLLGGLFGNSSAKKAAAQSIAFQREMAQNAHQYEVADLEAAGLNPMISGMGGSGAKASGGAVANVGDVISPAVNSALKARESTAALDNIKAQTGKNLADTDLSRAAAAKTRVDALLSSNNARTAAANATAAELSLPVKALQSKVDSGWLGTGSAYINKALEPITNLLHGATSAKSLAK
jgi:hypothetical protein